MEIPECLKQQISNEHFYFDYNGYEWKIEIRRNPDFLKHIVKTPIILFADDGYGNYLFIKDKDTKVYEYFHETSEMLTVDEPLEELIGLKKKIPSKDNYPEAVYETGEKVLLGDKVQFKVWVEFWKGWQNGIVTYVPKISPKKNKYEHNQLKWIEIKAENLITAAMILPETGIVEKIRFVNRGSL